MSLNPLDPIWKAYQSSRESLEVVKSAIKYQENFILARTHFASQTKEEAEQLLKETIKLKTQENSVSL
jgi:hypothetical protein